MRESRTPGSVRGVLSNGHSYRDRNRQDHAASSERHHGLRKTSTAALQQCGNELPGMGRRGLNFTAFPRAVDSRWWQSFQDTFLR